MYTPWTIYIPTRLFYIYIYYDTSVWRHGGAYCILCICISYKFSSYSGNSVYGEWLLAVCGAYTSGHRSSDEGEKCTHANTSRRCARIIQHAHYTHIASMTTVVTCTLWRHGVGGGCVKVPRDSIYMIML